MSKPKQRSKGNSRPQPKQNKPSQWLYISLGALVIIVLGGFVVWQQSNATPVARTLPAEISVAQAAEKRTDGAFILDVRQPEEWVDSHIPGATLIPLGELASRLDEVPQDQEVVVVCRSGNRSQEGRDILLRNGFDQVTSMAGGMNQWAASGHEVVSGP